MVDRFYIGSLVPPLQDAERALSGATGPASIRLRERIAAVEAELIALSEEAARYFDTFTGPGPESALVARLRSTLALATRGEAVR